MSALKEPLKQPCYFPFYKMMIDYNGDVLICSNDWKKEAPVGNISHESILDIWVGKILKVIDSRNTIVVITADHGEYVKPSEDSLENSVRNISKIGKKFGVYSIRSCISRYN